MADADAAAVDDDEDDDETSKEWTGQQQQTLLASGSKRGHPFGSQDRLIAKTRRNEDLACEINERRKQRHLETEATNGLFKRDRQRQRERHLHSEIETDKRERERATGD